MSATTTATTIAATPTSPRGLLAKSLDFKQLRLIATLQDTQSLTLASQQLHLSQPALSHQLRAVEEMMGAPLFERQGKKLIANPAGEHLAQKAIEILSTLSETVSTVKDLLAGKEGTIRISTECYTCYHWMPPIIKAFDAEHPNIKISVVELNGLNHHQAVASGEIDIGIMTCIPKQSPLNYHLVFKDELVLITGLNHKLSQKSEINLSELFDEHLILYAGTKQKYSDIFFRCNGIEAPEKITELQLTEAILEWVKADLGVTLMPKWAAAHYINSNSVKAIPIAAKEPIYREWYAATRYKEAPLPWETLISLIKKLPPTRIYKN